jgi:tetratricopeptide (TPR) repeat protein
MTGKDSFGATLRLLRKRARLTQDELGRAVGYSRAQIGLLERNRRHPDATVVAARFVAALALRPHSTDAAHLINSARSNRAARDAARQTVKQHDPIAEAVAWYLESNPDAALRLTNTLVPMWYQRGKFGEARRMLEQVLAKTGDSVITRERLSALLSSALFAQQQSDAHTAIRHAEEALTLAHQLEDAQGMIDALGHLGWAVYDQHNRDGALALFERKLAISRDHGLPHGEVDALLAMTNVSLLDAAWRPLWEEWLGRAEALSRTHAFDAALAHAAVLRVEAAVLDGKADTALTLVTAIVSEPARLSQRGIAGLLLKKGEALSQRGDFDAAAEALHEARTVFELLGDTTQTVLAEHHLAQIDLHRGDGAQASARFASALTYFEAHDNPYMSARCWIGLAECALAVNDRASANTWLAHADALMQPLRPFLSKPDERALDALRKRLKYEAS